MLCVCSNVSVHPLTHTHAIYTHGDAVFCSHISIFIYTHTHTYTKIYTGELETIALTQASSGTTSYIIIRPGGLSDKKAPLGMQGIQISQGDRVGGIITREDTALVTVRALLDEQAKNTVFELVSYKDSDTHTSTQTDQENGTDTHTSTIPHRYDDWSAFFSKLRQNDGRHDPTFYPIDELEGKGVSDCVGEGEGGEPTTTKTDL